MLRLCERFGELLGPTQEDVTAAEPFAPEIPQRYDAALNFVRTGGRFARREDPPMLAARTNYFRGTYSYGRPDDAGHRAVPLPRGLRRRRAPAPRAAARRARDRLRQPAAAGPGAGGAHRRARVPRRQPQALPAVADRGDAALRPLRRAGACRSRPASPTSATAPAASSPSTPTGPTASRARSRCAQHRRADGHRHGLPRRRPRRARRSRSRAPARRHAAPQRRRRHLAASSTASELVASYDWDELRFSVSWKAYCYADEAERAPRREPRGRPLARADPRDALRRPARPRPPRRRAPARRRPRAAADRGVRPLPGGASRRLTQRAAPASIRSSASMRSRSGPWKRASRSSASAPAYSASERPRVRSASRSAR